MLSANNSYGYLKLKNDNGTSQSKKNLQSFSMSFKTYQDFFLRRELLEYIDVHDNDACESSKPSSGKNVYFGAISSTSRGKYCILVLESAQDTDIGIGEADTETSPKRSL
ncbi:hypothetical protein Tco_1161086 [Tanacetum coccineum]